MPALLTSASQLMCPHGGMVTAVPGSTLAQAGEPILRGTDIFIIAGCPFVIGTVPSPCVRVQWLVTAQRVKHGGEFVLDAEASVGMCVAATQAPQGVAVLVETQASVQGQ